MRRGISAYVLWSAIIAGLVAGARADAPAATGDSLCVHFSGNVQGGRVALEHGYTLGGSLPVTICNLDRDTRYRLMMDGKGLERRVGALSRNGSGGFAVRGIQFSVISRNAVLPGWGSMYAGRVPAGSSDDLSLAASLVLLYGEEMEYRHLHNRLDVLQARFDEATTYEDRSRFQEGLHATSRELNVQNDHRRRLAALAGALYAWQVVEPLLADNPPGSSSGAEKGEIALRGRRESRPKAFFFSLVRPGRGQFYQGKIMRGALFSVAAAAGGLAALHYQNEYDRAGAMYENCIDRFNAADAVSEKERLRDEAVRLWADVEHQKDRRNAALIALAGVWGWNVLDTLFPGGDSGSGGGRFAFDIDARGACVAFRF